MKKKNVLMMALSLCLVAVIAVGGTLAYLSDSDGTLTNTFTFANNIVVEQTETWQDSDRVWNETATAKGGDTGYSYTNLVAGQQAHKNPSVSVETEVPTYVFVKVTGLGEGAKVSIVNNETYQNGLGDTSVWKQSVTLGNDVYYAEIEDDAEWTLFDTIQFAEDASNENIGSGIVIQVKAIQKAADLKTVEQAYGACSFDGEA